jgi:hypothetical protein
MRVSFLPRQSAGPYNLTQGGVGIVGMLAIFVAGSPTDTFGVPPGVALV